MTTRLLVSILTLISPLSIYAEETESDNRETLHVFEPDGTAPSETKEQLMDVVCGAAAEAGYKVTKINLPPKNEENPFESTTETRNNLMTTLNFSQDSFDLTIRFQDKKEAVSQINRRQISGKDLFGEAKKTIFGLLGTYPSTDNGATKEAIVLVPPQPITPLPNPQLGHKATPEEIKATSVRLCRTVKKNESTWKVFGVGLVTPLGLYPIFLPIFLFAIVDIISNNGDNGDRIDSSAKSVALTTSGIYLGVNAIVSSIVAKRVGSGTCYSIKFFPLFVGALMGAVFSESILWGYLSADTDNKNTFFTVMVFVVSPILLPTLAQTIAYILFRESKFPEKKPTENRTAKNKYHYSPPSPMVMQGHNGRGLVPGLSFGSVSF